MSTTIEAQGRTVDEAIQIALNQLGASRDKVEIEIIHHPRSGFLGIGARRAKVRATLRQGVMLDGEEFDMSGGELQEKPRRRRRRGGKGRTGRADGEPEVGSSEKPEAARDNSRDGDRRRRGADRPADGDSRQQGGRARDDRRGRSEPARGRDESRGGTGGDSQRGRGEPRDRRQQQGRGGGQGAGLRGGQVQDGRPRQEAPVQAPAPAAVRADRETPPVPRTPRPEVRNEPRAEERTFQETEAREAESSIIESLEPAEVRERAQALVSDLIARMGLVAEVSSWVDESTHEVVVSVHSESEGLLIGRRGQTLDAVEHIVNRMVLRGEGTGEGRVLLDIGDYRRRRNETLMELADRLRTRALGERRTVQVSPMSPRDRRFFQQALAADSSVEIRTLGAGFYRRMIVAPVGLGPAAMAEAEAAVGGLADEDVVEESGEGYAAGKSTER